MELIGDNGFGSYVHDKEAMQALGLTSVSRP